MPRFSLLELLGFSEVESVAGTLGLLCATTHLHYAQNMQENNYVLLLTIAGFALQYKWLKTGDRRALFWGSAALGLNLLTRLTTMLDLFAAGCFILLAVIFARREGRLEGVSRPAFEANIYAALFPYTRCSCCSTESTNTSGSVRGRIPTLLSLPESSGDGPDVAGEFSI